METNFGMVRKIHKQAVEARPGYDARRIRTQREVIRDVLLAAADCGTWLTLHELMLITRYGQASISAQMRNLRKSESGGYVCVKRERGKGSGHYITWEYRLQLDQAPGGLVAQDTRRSGEALAAR